MIRTPDGELASPLPGGNVLFRVERAVTPMFGFLTFGVHLTGYQVDPLTGVISIWVPRRAKSKPTCVPPLCSIARKEEMYRFPGMLDQTVAGGIPSGLTPFETLVKECQEEASLDASFVEKHARAAGAVSYIRKSETGYIQPEIQYGVSSHSTLSTALASSLARSQSTTSSSRPARPGLDHATTRSKALSCSPTGKLSSAFSPANSSRTAPSSSSTSSCDMDASPPSPTPTFLSST